jgi:hypothetical protein
MQTEVAAIVVLGCHDYLKLAGVAVRWTNKNCQWSFGTLIFRHFMSAIEK